MLSVVTFLTECALCSLLTKLGINPISSLLAVCFIILFSIAFFIDLSKSKKLRKYNIALAIGYLFRVLFLLFDRYGQSIMKLPNSGADTEWFYELSVAQASALPRYDHGDFIALFGTIFSIIGTNRLFGQFIIVLFSVIALFFLALTIDELKIDVERKIQALLIVSILPNFAILSSIFLRESIVSMFITISFYCFMRHYRGGSIGFLLLCYAFVLAGSYFHSGTAGLLVGYTVVVFLHQRDIDANHISIQRIVLGGIIAFFLLQLYVRYNAVFFGKMSNLEKISDIANTSNAGGSSYAMYVGNSDSILNIIIYTIPRFVFFLFSPFPWQWRDFPDIIAFLFSGLYYLYVIFIAFRCIVRKESKNRTLVINGMIILACVVFVFAWGVSSAGTAARHRDKLVTLFAALHALCLLPINNYRRYSSNNLHGNH